MSEEISDLNKKGVEILIKLVKRRMNEIKGNDLLREEYIILEDYLKGYISLRDGEATLCYKIGEKK